MKNLEATTNTDTNANVAPQAAHVAPAAATPKKGTSQKKTAPKGQRTAKGGKTKTAPAKTAKQAKAARKPTAPRAESKSATILDMMRRAKGVTLAEIMKAADWQAHSVRGFVSTAVKRYGVLIESSKNEAGDRVYRISK
jgi:hypothetical protein